MSQVNLTDTIQVYNSDCMEALREMPDNAYSLAIVDPPYGISESSKNFASRGKLARADKYEPKDWDACAPAAEYFEQLMRVSRNQIMWGGNYFELPPTSCVIVWDKDNGNNDFSDCELAWGSFPTAVRKFKFRWNGMLQQNMKQKEHRIHPTQKPVALYEWLLTNYAKEGDTILDSHLGSGSITIACHRLGFSLTGYEIDADYFEAMTARFKKEKAKPELPLNIERPQATQSDIYDIPGV